MKFKFETISTVIEFLPSLALVRFPRGGKLLGLSWIVWHASIEWGGHSDRQHQALVDLLNKAYETEQENRSTN